ncbi:MAG: sulfur carrier protein ThiS [Chthoniobacterales bacterium]
MKIWLNGELADAQTSRTVAELAAHFSLPANSVLVEHNGLALRPREWATSGLSEGDRVEFVRVVAGG